MALFKRRFRATDLQALDDALDNNDCFVMRLSALYLKRVLERYPVLDRDVIAFACWALGPGTSDLTEVVLDNSSEKNFKRLQEDFEDCLDGEDYARIILKSIKYDKAMAKKVLRNLLHLLDQRYNSLKKGQQSMLSKNSQKFKKLFSLDKDEQELCLFLFLANSWDPVQQLFFSHFKVDFFAGRKYLLAALGFSSATLNRLLSGKLKKLGIVKKSDLGFDLKDDFVKLFIDPENHLDPESLYSEVQEIDIPLDYHLICESEVKFIKGLLQEKTSLSKHILIYGPAGTGKTSFVRALTGEMPDPAYEVRQGSKNESEQRRAALLACINMTNSGNGGSIVIIDEADRMLNTRSGFMFSGEVQDKGWLNSFMEQPGVRAVWIVNDTGGIEDSVLRRFSYSLHFTHFSRQKRIQLWKTIVSHNKAGRYFKKDTIHKLAEDYKVSPGVIDLAVKQAGTAGKAGRPFARRVRMSLDAHLRLSNQGMIPKKQDALDRNFNLEGLNIDGDIHETIDQLEYFNSQARQAQDHKVLQYNLLFYGPPGTGKSQLAKYLARELDRDIMIRRGSDLLDKYVGETEKLIAGMFAEAEAKEAVLVVDEADSFIFGREMAQRSWEVGMVNEFLTCMESYQGILICTTNRFKGLDNASIRRFNQKLYFDYLNKNGVEIFYRKFLSPLCRDKMLPQHLTRLGKLTSLTPGDFKNIRDIHVMKSNTVNHTTLLAALEQESRLKEQQEGKKVGF